MLTVYLTKHVHSKTVGGAFARGAKAPMITGATKLAPGDAGFYGWLRGLEPLLRQAQGDPERDWWYLDNGYFKPGHYDGYYRVTRNAYMHSGFGTGDMSRWARLGIQIEPWKRGAHVLVCPPGDLAATHRGFNAQAWLRQVLDRLKEHTDREVRVRAKDARTPLQADLEGCHALVTAFSNAAVEAVVAGVPVFCTHPCSAAAMGQSDLDFIESPRYPEDRERWASVLAANQFTLKELKNGTAWQTLNGR